MADSRRDLTGQVLDRRFRVEGLLGSGGMGAVWQVQHIESLQRWALKTIDPTHAANPLATDRFLREARAAGALRSRHVTRVIDAQMGYQHDGAPMPFLVMELLEGCTLEQMVVARGRLRPGELLWVARQLGRALTAAHQRGIVHRDLKPSNVFIARDEEREPGDGEPGGGESIVKLCDFGIAKLFGDAQALVTEAGLSTQTGAMIGTPMYLAPELLHGAGGAVPATDQWALGLVAFRALTGGEYFARARGVAALVLAIAQEPLIPPSKLSPAVALPAGFDAWFQRACAREPGDRFPDVAAQIGALEKALGRPEPKPLVPERAAGPQTLEISATSATAVAGSGEGEHLGALSSSGAPPRPRRRGAVARAAYVAAACGWAIASLWWMHGRTRPEKNGGDGARNGDRQALSRLAESAAAAPTPPAPAAPEARADEAPRPATPASPTAGAAPIAPPASAPASAPHRRATRPRAGKKVAGAEAPGAAAPPRGLSRGQPCQRSAECASGLCAAETCQ